MENREQVPENESNKTFQKGSIRPNPTRHNRTNLGGDPPGGNADVDPNETGEEATEFDSGNAETEINPGQLDREEINLDRTGVDDTEVNGPHNFKSQMDSDEDVEGSDGPSSTGPHKRRSQKDQGQRKGVGGGNDAKIKEAQKENLLGQGGYGTSGTSGTNSGRNQGYQSGPGSAVSQNGSTGYSAGSPGHDINHRR